MKNMGTILFFLTWILVWLCAVKNSERKIKLPIQFGGNTDWRIQKEHEATRPYIAQGSLSTQLVILIEGQLVWLPQLADPGASLSSFPPLSTWSTDASVHSLETYKGQGFHAMNISQQSVSKQQGLPHILGWMQLTIFQMLSKINKAESRSSPIFEIYSTSHIWLF